MNKIIEDTILEFQVRQVSGFESDIVIKSKVIDKVAKKYNLKKETVYELKKAYEDEVVKDQEGNYLRMRREEQENVI